MLPSSRASTFFAVVLATACIPPGNQPDASATSDAADYASYAADQAAWIAGTSHDDPVVSLRE